MKGDYGNHCRAKILHCIPINILVLMDIHTYQED